VRILLVEDNDVFRAALEFLFSLRDDIEVVGSIGDGAAAAAAAAEHEPDVVLMDYRLPGMDGVHATRAVRDASPHSVVVCLTASANSREIEALYSAGAAVCLTKDQELDEIVAAIKSVAANDA
jgi:DNA-binding NarL/FixJ family response regulator